MRGFLLAVILLITSAPVRAAEAPSFTVDNLYMLERLGSPRISPDGQQVVYTVTSIDMAMNSSSTDLWLVSADGKSRRRLTATGKRDGHPRWSPDSKRILFQSNRSGSTQLWLLDLEGGQPRQITDVATGAWNGVWSPDGKSIAFLSAVFPEFSSKPFKESNALNKNQLDERKNNPVKARVFTKLFFRHWDSYVEGTRQHIFVMSAPGRTHDDKLADPRDVTPGDRDAYPTSGTFSMGDDFTFSPDSKALVYTAPPARAEAWSTNHDIWRVPLTNPPADPENLTKGNTGADGMPVYSPDGKWLAYRAQARAGYEADRWQLMIVPAKADGSVAGKPRSLSSKFDHSVDDIVWGPGSTSITLTAEVKGQVSLFQVDVKAAEVRPFFERDHSLHSLSMAGDGRLVFTQDSLLFPARVMTIDNGKGRLLADAGNDAFLKKHTLPTLESVTVKGAGGTPMQMWILKPPGFDESKKWPLVYLVHGGPQGAWDDSWSWRWNPMLWSSQGYVVALPNPRGSTGFGQKYTEEISGDWGGKVYEDLMLGMDYLEKLPYIDKSRMAAAGASYGGYMMNWFQGHTNRFKTLITHCGVYNLDSMYGATEELWFPEWDLGGKPWDDKADSYKKFSPHRFARNFKTPMLIIHGDLDFRVPVTQGLELFTTLQRQGVASKMINFPDEGHWVSKPANGKFWHEQVFAWLKKYVPPGAK